MKRQQLNQTPKKSLPAAARNLFLLVIRYLVGIHVYCVCLREVQVRKRTNAESSVAAAAPDVSDLLQIQPLSGTQS